jgi:hypothetical protein
MDLEALANRPAARFFTLKGRGLEIAYYSGAGGGVAHLSVSDEHGERTFSGAEIRVEPNQLGTLVSVYLSVIADGDSTTLTLVLPAVNLPASGKVNVGALAIYTTHRNTLAGPGILDGALELYKNVALKGRASAGLEK